MHAGMRACKIHGRGPEGKAIVMGAVERGGEVRAAVVPTRRKGDVQSHIREHVMAGATLYIDALKSYDGWTNFSIR